MCLFKNLLRPRHKKAKAKRRRKAVGPLPSHLPHIERMRIVVEHLARGGSMENALAKAGYRDYVRASHLNRFLDRPRVRQTFIKYGLDPDRYKKPSEPKTPVGPSSPVIVTPASGKPWWKQPPPPVVKPSQAVSEWLINTMGIDGKDAQHGKLYIPADELMKR